MKNVKLDYEPHMFEISVKDFEELGKAVSILHRLKKLKIHNCRVKDIHIKALIRQIINHTSLIELEFPYCEIVDIGAKCLGELILQMEQLEHLNLRSNKINAEGAHG